MVELPEHLARLSPGERRATLKHLLARQGRQQIFHPLSAGQRTLWFLHHIGVAGSTQNFPIAFRTLKPLDEAQLRQSLRDLIERHPILRTTYELRAGEPLQRVNRDTEPVLRIVDAAGWSESELQSRVADDAYQAFDLAAGPVFRTTLFQRSDQEQILLLAWHHIAMDGWSLVIALGDLSRLYELRRRGVTPDFPPVTPYGEFVNWQQRQLATEKWKNDAAYWRSTLHSDIPRLRLPADYPESVSGSDRAGTVTFLVDENLRSRLRSLARDADTTLFTVLLAAYQVLLCRYSGQEHVMVRVPTTGRPSHRFEATLGFFVNQIVLHGEIRAGMTFHTLLARTKQRVLEVLERGDYPLSLLLESLPPSIEPGFSRFTGTMFILQKLPGARRESSPEDLSQEVPLSQRGESEHELLGVPVKAFPFEPRASGFELDFQLLDSETQILGVVMYRRSMFEQVTVERWACHLQTLYQRICDNPHGLISDIAALPDEQEDLLNLWNKTDKSYPTTGIGVLFEERARKTPEAVAVEYGNKRTSYRELRNRVDYLAARLRSAMQESGSLVAVFLPRSVDFIAAMLSARKAGAAYVPVDPSLPVQEVSRVLSETSPAAILTTSILCEELPPTDAVIVMVDDNPPPHAADAGQEIRSSAADSLLYVLSTSGSAGQRKAVMGTEAATLNRLHWMWEQYPYETGEVACLTSGPGFVDSVAAILGPLLKGVRLVIADQEILLDTDRFLNFLAAHKITRLTVVPSLLRMLLKQRQSLGVRVPTLRYCVCSGEALTVPLAKDFLSEAPNVTLLNLYGCSEAGGDSTCYEMRQDWDLDCVPIGRPIANTKVHVLDEQCERVPIGVAGEIAISGQGLARGYWNRRALTEERFTKLPGSGERRIYRTGDRGRYLHDGTIQFLGRLDRQVQIRGQRVEPSEIEDVLASHPDVLQVCVRPWSEDGEPMRLAAYVVTRSASAVRAAELRAYVTVRLADAKIPSAYIFLDALPLSVNGKLDPKNLPNPAEALARQSEANAPRNSLEEIVTAVWCDVLGLSEVGIYDHFFELGGHSILATRAVSRLREILSTEIPLRFIFLHPTVAAFSSALLETPERERVEQVAAAVVEVSTLSEDEVNARLQEPAQRGDT